MEFKKPQGPLRHHMQRKRAANLDIVQKVYDAVTANEDWTAKDVLNNIIRNIGCTRERARVYLEDLDLNVEV